MSYEYVAAAVVFLVSQAQFSLEKRALRKQNDKLIEAVLQKQGEQLAAMAFNKPPEDDRDPLMALEDVMRDKDAGLSTFGL